MIELLSPVGDFECLKAAVQNGADSVYFGANMFSARASAKNFDLENLENAINYAKLRGVKTNLTLNILIKNNEFSDAFELAKKAYEFGIDAIIVQDLGLASVLIKNFPDLAIHASTQMSVHNLEGVKKLEKLGFKRVVLSRELSIQEIEYICKNTNIEIECFIHGALCISYSGQCIFSSLVGGRSGNRGRCAQPCRLPYTLLENDKEINKGYLLSPRDLCGLEYLPNLIKAGVTCLKIEGRMKTPDYVATVTKTYRKYIDMILNNSYNKNIDEQDMHDLMQAYNRGSFTNGHLSNAENRNLIFKEKPSNIGIFLGTVTNFNNNKGHVTLNLKDTISIGDKISISTCKEDSVYTVSELMLNNQNIPTAEAGISVKIGRMKGNIKIGDKIYKIFSKQLSDMCKITYSGQELRKSPLKCAISIQENTPVTISVSDNIGNIVSIVSELVPVKAISAPITKERIETQLSKTNNTPFYFDTIDITLGENLHLPSISGLNELRRHILAKYENSILSKFKNRFDKKFEYTFHSCTETNISPKKISLLLNTVQTSFDYSLLSNNIDRIYVPLKYLFNNTYHSALENISKKADLYIYMPCVMRNKYTKLFKKHIDNILRNFEIKGFVISNIGQFELLDNYKSFDFIANYTMNLYNNETAKALEVSTVAFSPELAQDDLLNISVPNKSSEIIFYGNIPVMHCNYCLLGNSNKCYKDCSKKCMLENKYHLKDRLGISFRFIPDNIDTVTTIYNSKITSISTNNICCDFARIDILDESIFEINNIVKTVLSGNRFEGKNYTNGNINRVI
ncbi:MAG: U32 family peptidase [Clostridia bacterium]|nr:U32 family peptidase [Clostridia bacterium]